MGPSPPLLLLLLGPITSSFGIVRISVVAAAAFLPGGEESSVSFSSSSYPLRRITSSSRAAPCYLRRRMSESSEATARELADDDKLERRQRHNRKRRQHPLVKNFRRVGGLPDTVNLYRCANTDRLADHLVKSSSCGSSHHSSRHSGSRHSAQNASAESDRFCCSEQDAAARRVLLHDAGLILDLRSDSERNEEKAQAWMAAAPGGPFTVQRNRLVLPPVGAYEAINGDSKPKRRRRFCLRLDPVSPSTFLRYVERTWFTPHQKMQAAFFKIANGQALHNMFIAALNERGLVGLNECILEAGQKELLEALKAVTVYLETHPTEAVVMHCVQGKDRTGLLAMLCQSMLDVSDDDIVADYYLSSVQLDDGGAAAAAATAAVAVAQGKLDRRFFSGAPAEVMEETLSVLRRRYGSVQPGYLDHIGFNEAWRSRFVAAVQQAEQPPTLNNRL